MRGWSQRELVDNSNIRGGFSRQVDASIFSFAEIIIFKEELNSSLNLKTSSSFLSWKIDLRIAPKPKDSFLGTACTL